MPSGSRPNSGFSRAAAALLAATLACGAANAQQKSPGDIGLRIGTNDLPLPLDPPPGATTDSSTTPGVPPPPGKPKVKSNAAKLPPLKPYAGAQRLELRGGPSAPDASRTNGPGSVPGPTVAATPTPPPRRRIPLDENPYDPLGLRLGDLKLTPYVEQDVGWASNPLGIAGAASGSGFETTEVGAALQSDWSRGDLHGALKGGYTNYFATPGASGPFGSGTLDDRYDISRDLSVDAEGRFNVTREPLSALGVVTTSPGGIDSQTTVSTFGASIGGARKFGDLTLALHGSYDRTAYEDVSFSTGGVASTLATDDSNEFGLSARGSYRWSDAVSPFVELRADTRRYDGLTDAEGYERNSAGVSAKAGLTLAYSKELTGEASVGYGARDYQDPRLPDVRAPLIDASLIWSATPLTTVTLKAQSQLQDSVLAGASADINRNYTIDVSHALTRAIRLGVTAGYSTDNYIGVALRDSTAALGATAEYHFSREIVLKASATHTQFVSSAPYSNYVDNVFMLGVRLQR